MADFCYNCVIEHLGMEDGKMNDLAGLTTKEQNENGIYAYILCEGCGEMIYVDCEGKKVIPSQDV